MLKYMDFRVLYVLIVKKSVGLMIEGRKEGVRDSGSWEKGRLGRERGGRGKR